MAKIRSEGDFQIQTDWLTKHNQPHNSSQQAAEEGNGDIKNLKWMQHQEGAQESGEIPMADRGNRDTVASQGLSVAMVTRVYCAMAPKI